MPKKYHVAIRQIPPLRPRVSRYSRIELDGCLGCIDCVKRRSCLYEAYDHRRFDPDLVMDVGDDFCVSCMRCVQECKKGILTRAVNPRFERIGNDYWTPDLVHRTWKQAETGKIPVSGAGYRGRFAGPGFDSMWTDMSEIVRPTRDGIHGREYISTLIQLGRRPPCLCFDGQGALVTRTLPLRDIMIPVVLAPSTTGLRTNAVRRATALAARSLGTVAVATAAEAGGVLADLRECLMVELAPDGSDLAMAAGAPVLVLPDGPDVEHVARLVRESRPDAVVGVRVPLDGDAVRRTSALASGPADLIDLEADPAGRGLGDRKDAFVTTLVREVHLGLVSDRVRDRVTLLVTGGIAQAEHVAKAIICGADGVGIGHAVMVALECRLCGRCARGEPCDADIPGVTEQWATQRIVNLVGSWHSQIIEVMGAMGIREVRRLRGEVGRSMTFEELERACFVPLFGPRERFVPDPPDDDPPSRPAAPVPPRDLEPARFAGLASTQPSRFRNALGRHRVTRTTACISCGKCTEICEHGVHRRAGARMLAPASHLCRGADHCRSRGRLCVEACPRGALRVGPDPAWDTFGDPRWTPDLILATWEQATTGRPPANGLEYRTGRSGGGFDRMDILLPDEPVDLAMDPGHVDLSIPLNRTGDGRPEVVIGIPMYGGGMSYGSISLSTMVGRARAWTAFDSFTCTGEGGYPAELEPYDDHVITQIATGLFGVREQTIQRVRMVEFKYAQGAKPGLGGHLLGDKVTSAVARIREAVQGSSLFSPFPFHSVYSVEDHKKHVDWVKMVNERAIVSIKVSTPTDVDMVAVGSYHAGAHVVHIDGSYGGTGAAPDIAKKNIAMPIEYAIPKVHGFLVTEGIRDRITLIASGGIRSAHDVVKAIALGADGVVIGTPEMVALECVRCGVCESGRGCPRGIATTDPDLSLMYDVPYAAQRITNLLNAWCVELTHVLWLLGIKSVRDLVGRSDLLRHRDHDATKGPR